MEFRKEKRGYLKIHVAENVKTNKEILDLEVTDEKIVHDGSKVLKKLVKHVLDSSHEKKNKVMKIKSVLA